EDAQPQEAQAQDVLLSDTFTRQTSKGWGSADFGGNWSAAYGVSRISVDGSAGVLTMTGAGTSNSLSSPIIDATSTDSRVDFVLEQATTGPGAYVSYIGRANESGSYQLGFHVALDGAVTMTVSKKVGGVETPLGSSRLNGSYSAGQKLHVRFVVNGAESTKLQAKAWIGDGDEPEGWGVDVTDDDAALAAPGSVGFGTFTSGKADGSPLTLRVDDLTVRRVA
ncbi:MAG: hypothetical protein Q4A20_10915, partial [Actinomyces sp.]|nr:hypothetical protein [Actinomyces sp.]